MSLLYVPVHGVLVGENVIKPLVRVCVVRLCVVLF